MFGPSFLTHKKLEKIDEKLRYLFFLILRSYIPERKYIQINSGWLDTYYLLCKGVIIKRCLQGKINISAQAQACRHLMYILCSSGLKRNVFFLGFGPTTLCERTPGIREWMAIFCGKKKGCMYVLF